MFSLRASEHPMFGISLSALILWTQFLSKINNTWIPKTPSYLVGDQTINQMVSPFTFETGRGRGEQNPMRCSPSDLPSRMSPKQQSILGGMGFCHQHEQLSKLRWDSTVCWGDICTGCLPAGSQSNTCSTSRRGILSFKGWVEIAKLSVPNIAKA